MDDYREYKLPRDMMIDEISFVNFGGYKQVDGIYSLNKNIKDLGIIINKGELIKLPVIRNEKDKGEKEQIEEMIELWD